jgi:hypothetical protein
VREMKEFLSNNIPGSWYWNRKGFEVEDWGFTTRGLSKSLRGPLRQQ